MRLFTFLSFISPKKLLSVHLSALCNEPEHVKDLLKNPENFEPLAACCSDRAKTFSLKWNHTDDRTRCILGNVSL